MQIHQLQSSSVLCNSLCLYKKERYMVLFVIEFKLHDQNDSFIMELLLKPSKQPDLQTYCQ